jgi:hypothetical protein
MPSEDEDILFSVIDVVVCEGNLRFAHERGCRCAEETPAPIPVPAPSGTATSPSDGFPPHRIDRDQGFRRTPPPCTSTHH